MDIPYSPVRTEQMMRKLMEAPQEDDCFMCGKEGEKTFDFKIIRNKYPYDKLAQTHDMLVTVRHIAEEHEMTDQEQADFIKIKRFILPELGYNVVWLNMPNNRTHPGHLHWHLLKLKKW